MTVPPTPVANDVAHVATAVVILLLLAQAPAMHKVIRHLKSTEHLSIVPTLGQASNFISWSVYGLWKGDINLWLVNVIGIGFAAVYTSIFLAYARGKQLKTLLVALASIFVCFTVYYLIVLKAAKMSPASTEIALQIFAVLPNIVMYGAPISQIMGALRTMDPEAIPILLTAAGAGCSVLWAIYGYMVDNWAVYIPNYSGVALSAIQIAVAAYIITTVRRTRKNSFLSDGSDDKVALVGDKRLSAEMPMDLESGSSSRKRSRSNNNSEQGALPHHVA